LKTKQKTLICFALAAAASPNHCKDGATLGDCLL
jgi:hypothetical protein